MAVVMVPNEKNLVPNEKRTPKERRRNAQKAGKASGEARRRRKSLKENMNILLELPVAIPDDYNILAEMGIDPKDTDNAMLLTAALFRQAKKGDVAAYKEIRNLIGESGGAQPNQLEDDPITRSLKEAERDGAL